jgi:hypothetical protein
MNEITFTIDQLLSMARPADYLDQLAACAISRNEEAMSFDTDSDCYLQLKTQYAHYRPTEEDQARVAAYKRGVLKGKLPSESLAALLEAYRAGCNGCHGRNITA